nr:hypothetical protein [Tanacetum cinerariifolium]
MKPTIDTPPLGHHHLTTTATPPQRNYHPKTLTPLHLTPQRHQPAGESVDALEICCRRQKHRCSSQKAAATVAEHLVLPEFE